MPIFSIHNPNVYDIAFLKKLFLEISKFDKNYEVNLSNKMQNLPNDK